VLQSAATVIIFDMAGVDYMSSAGVRVVLKARKVLKKKNGKALLVNLRPPIKKVFEIIKALPTTDVFSSVKELDQYLDRMQRQTT
jgi:anti-anti-sigma factor